MRRLLLNTTCVLVAGYCLLEAYRLTVFVLARAFFLARVGDVVVFTDPGRLGFGERWRLTELTVAEVRMSDDYSSTGRAEDCVFHRVDSPTVVDERPCVASLYRVEWSLEDYQNRRQGSYAEARDAPLRFRVGEQVIKKPGPLDTASGRRWVVHEGRK